MRAVLFGEQVEEYEDVIVHNGEYEITNAIIMPINEHWKFSSGDLDYQMSFGKYTIVRSIDGTVGSVTPQYVKLCAIPKLALATDRFDALAVVLFVEEAPGRVVRIDGRSNTVQGILLIDDSLQHPLLVSAWNTLAERVCKELSTSSSCLPVVGITALKPSIHKGSSLSTTMSTSVVHNPTGNQAKELQTWVSQNRQSLSKMRLKILAAKSDSSAVPVAVDEFLGLKKDDYASFSAVKDQFHTQSADIQVLPSTALSQKRDLQCFLQQLNLQSVKGHEKQEDVVPSAKRRLVLLTKHNDLKDSESEAALEYQMIETLSTMSYEANGSPSPDPSPRSPFND